MHIPDGYLGPETYISMYAVMTPLWMTAFRKVKKALKKREVPRLALAGAFSFVIMLFSLPVPGGTTAHPVGGTLIAIILGPWAAVISISVALVIQAFVFGDGGITALGANCFSAAFVGPFVGYYLWKFFKGRSSSPRRAAVGAAIAGFVSLNATAQISAVLVGIQPLIAKAANGRPLYAPYPLAATVPAMAFAHLFAGLAEAAVTVLALAYLEKAGDRVLVQPETE